MKYQHSLYSTQFPILYIIQTEPKLMADSSPESQAFNTTHGRQVDGKFYTYKQLESKSFLQTVKDAVFYFVLIVLVVFCLVCFYEVDYKKGNQSEVIGKIVNYSMVEIVNGSLEITEEFKRVIKTTIETNSQRGAEIKQWMANKTGSIYSEIKNTINTTTDGQESVLDYVLHLPVYLKKQLLSVYNTYLKRYFDAFSSKIWQAATVPQEEKVSVPVEEKVVEIETFTTITTAVQSISSTTEQKSDVIATK